MPKSPKLTLEDLAAKHEALAATVAKLQKSAATSASNDEVTLPPSSKVAKLSASEIATYVEKLGIKGVTKEKAQRALITSVSTLAEGDEIEADAADALISALGLSVKSKKIADKLTELKKYLNVKEESDDEDEDEEDDDEEDDDDEEEAEKKKPAKKDKKGKKDEEEEEEDDEEEDDDDDEEEEEEDDDDDEDEEEKPKKKDKKSKDDDDEEDEDEEDEEDEDEEDDEEEDDDDEEEVDEKTATKRLALVKKAAPKVYKALKGKTEAAKYKALMTVDDELQPWGEPYADGEEGKCCGVELEETDVKNKKGSFGKCVVTGTIYQVKDDGTFKKI